jgi:nucleoside-diphosphate-sugar epimerase
MRVFVAGATGAIGRPLIRQLIAAGYQVVAITRSSQRAHSLAEQGAIPEYVDIFDAEAVHTVLNRTRPDVVIDQLTALPKTYTRQSMRAAASLNDHTRQTGRTNLLTAAQAVGVHRYIMQSCAFWYAPGVGLATEATPFALHSSPAIAAGTRIYANLEQRLLSTSGIEGIALRYGFFYGPGTWYAVDGDMAQQVRQQQFPILGDGQGVWSWIHVEDAAIATVAAVEQGRSGAYNIVDDTPAQMDVWLPAYAHWLEAKPPLRISSQAALQSQDADAVYYATKLRGASNLKAKQELSFQPRSLEWLVHTPFDVFY